MTPSDPAKAYAFPDGFTWGAATAAFQIEGAARIDGRKPSVWDALCDRPGRIRADHTGEVACDHYHRYRDDVRLMADLGLQAYRFSLSWPRILPDGDGTPNAKGLDFYDRLVDALLAAGVTPYVTLFHWDLPQALEERFGGWRSRETALRFGEYAGVAGKLLGDRVKHFFTINEFLCFTDLGYGGGGFAPGLSVDAATLNAVRHNALLAHGLGVKALRGACPGDCRIGLAENISTTVPVVETEANIEAARRAFHERFSFFLRTVLEGAYPESHLQGPDAPKVEAGDLETIGASIDLVGINSYSPVRVRAADNESGWEALPDPDTRSVGNNPWSSMGPEVIYWGPRWLHELWGVDDVVFSENGCPQPDRPDTNGEVHDIKRVTFLRQHLQAAHRCVAEGYPLRGYFFWSLMDNFEWLYGYTERFGLFYVNFTTQERIPKLSAQYYREVIRQNRVV